MLNKKLYTFLFGVIAMLSLAFVSLFAGFLTLSNNKAQAATTFMTVEKVFISDKSKGELLDPREIRHVAESATTIQENDFVILNTSRHQFIDSNKVTYEGREAIFINFPGTNTSKGIPTITIFYNDTIELKRNEVAEFEDDNEKETFTQYLFAITLDELFTDLLDYSYLTQYKTDSYDLDNLTPEQSEALSLRTYEGKYSIVLEYFDVDKGQQRETTTFYITTQKTYNQVNENPTLNDTEKLDAPQETNPSINTYYQMTAQNNYFNFNNANTSYFDEGEKKFITGRFNASDLYYPTLVYNPEKFDVAFTRTLYNYRETTSLSFEVRLESENDQTIEVGYLTVRTFTTENPTNVITRDYILKKATGKTTFEVKLQFDRVGEYEITKTPRLKIGMIGSSVNYITPTAEVITANEEYLTPLTLTINGYVANYSNSATTKATLFNDTYAYNTMEGANINKTADIVYSRDFLTPARNQTISQTPRTRAETVYTADITFNNASFTSNLSAASDTTISMQDLKTQIANFASIPANAPDSQIYSKFFAYIENSNYINLNGTHTLPDRTTVYTRYPSTNLAPVSFDFYGRLETGTSSQYASWYAYKDTSGNVSVNRYTRGLQFENAGIYVVYLTYQNTSFSSSNQNGSRQYEFMHQLFCFEITNTTPIISVLKQDNSKTPTIQSSNTAEALGVDAYTNEYVYATWETAGPFDADIYCTYNIYNYSTGETLATNRTLNGLIYQTNPNTGSLTPLENNNPSLLYGDFKTDSRGQRGIDGYYELQVFRSNNNKAFVNYTFTIDTQPISGIKTLQVIGNMLASTQGNDKPNVLSELATGKFNPITSSAFAFTWDEKASNAPITAQYLYASITKSTNYDLVRAITGRNDATETDAVNKLMTMQTNGSIYMPTNATLGVFTPAMKYNKVNANSYTDMMTPLTTSQIINTPQLAFLLLRDEAGNTAIFASILDTTNTQVLQSPRQSSFVNVITEDTGFYWGTHKSIKADKAVKDPTSTLISDIYDFENTYTQESADKGFYSWTLNDHTYTSNDIFTAKFKDMNIATTGAINLPISQVSINASDNKNLTLSPGKTLTNYAENWYAIITVEKENEPFLTRANIDNIQSETFHSIENNEFGYTLFVWDEAGNHNNGGLNIEVNLDKSLGSARSYYEFDGIDLTYNRNLDKGPITDRQYVQNTYSTDRRYFSFSWTEPGQDASSSFSIKDIVLEFYPYAGNDKSSNYPYGDTPTTITLYSADKGYEATYEFGKIHKVTRIDNNITTYFYQTDILRKLPYSTIFSSSASEAGKYVITRTYSYDGSQDDLSDKLDGDSIEKIYTYYVDRNPILPTGAYDYGDIALQFGYNKGEYSSLGYPNYPTSGSITFDNYGLLNNSDGFDKVSLNTNDIQAITPNNIITQSNVLPSSVNMSYWNYNNNDVYDKYYSNAQDAINNIEEILDSYKNATRVQIAIQFFANTSSSQYALTSQTFYSSTVSTDMDIPQALAYQYSKPLSSLQHAFTDIGRYRVILFDLSNYEGLLSGNAYTDFSKIGISLSTDTSNTLNTLYPNCSVVSFELIGKAPTFDYQVGINSYATVNSANIETLTNDSKARISWQDPSDIYEANIAYNDISIIKTTIPKGNDYSEKITTPERYKKYFSLSSTIETEIFKNPVEITASEAVHDKLVAENFEPISLDAEAVSKILASGLASIQGEINKALEKPGVEGYFLYPETQKLLEAIINNGLISSDLQNVEFYKIRNSETSELFTYYLLLPKSYIEDINVNEDKLADTRYAVKVQYIAKDKNDYLVDNKETYFSTTRELYVDNTAPYYNLVDLIENDTYINSLGESFKTELIQNIDNPDSTFLKSYAFAVAPGFTVKYQNKYESNTKFYYRKYADYTGKKNGQTITTADIDKTGAPVFNKASAEYEEGNYANLSGYIAKQFNETGYYDIIEQDVAGNLRVYTIFVTNDAFTLTAENGQDFIQLNEGTVLNKVYHSQVLSQENNNGFRVTSLSTEDLWVNIKLSNNMDASDSIQFYYVPSDAVSDIIDYMDPKLVSSDMDYIIDEINNFIISTAEKHEHEYGSQIKFTITNRLNLNNSNSFLINTQGLRLISSESGFLALITEHEDIHRFVLRLPNTTGILSTKLTDFKVFETLNNQTTRQIKYDTSMILLPTKQSEFESEQSINTGYYFTLANNIIYTFEFTDNFGRTNQFSYPLDSSLIKRLDFLGGTTEHVFENKTYTYTSNAVNLVYQSTGLYLSMTISDLNTGKTLYTKNYQELLDQNNELFTYTRDSLASSIITISFNALPNLHNHVYIEISNGTDVLNKYEFVLYTYYPNIILSDTSGTPIQNYITSKEVMLSWIEVENPLFNPYVEIVYPDGSRATIDSGFVVKQEGTYTVRCINDMGICHSSSVTFTIQDYIVSIYGVYQLIDNADPVQLAMFTDSYTYTTPDGEMNIAQYLFLSNDTNWDRNIMILTNEDKDLSYEAIETYGNTRIFHVHGEYLFHIDIYFAVTRIPTLNVSTYTNFRINNDATLLTQDFKTGDTTITWNTVYTDSSSVGRTYNYPNFFTLDLLFNGTFVGSYTTGSIKLTNAGIYTITIRDPVGQKHNFGTRAGSTTFQLTILTNVVYYVNNNAAIPYATYSDAVDFYVPALSYYDYTPTVTFFRNNLPYEITPNADGHYTFTTPGVYKAVMKGSIETIIGTVPEAQLTTTYQFVIVSPNEAITSHSFTPVSGYEIIQVLRLDNNTDITDSIRGESVDEKITSLYIDSENYGIGRYQITIRVAQNGYNPSQTYTYRIWVNNETVSLIPNRDWGSNSTSPFSITLNIASIYERIGECQITVNGTNILSISEANKNQIAPVTLTPATAQGDYIIQLVSASGTILQSYRMTIDEPLNTAAIILIVIAVVVVIGLVVVFILMRNRVKVR